MTSIARRASAELLRTIAQTLDPGPEADRALMYAKAVGGTPQFFVRSPDYPRQVSGIECNIFDRPLEPHALDDEFDSTTLDPSWTVTGAALTPNAIDPYSITGAAYALHTNYRPSWLMVQPEGGTSTRWTKDISSIAGNDFFVWMRGSFNLRSSAVANDDALLSVDLSTASWDPNNRVTVHLNESDVNTVQAQFFKREGGILTSVGDTANMFVSQLGMQPIEAVGMTKIGNTIHGWAFGASGHAIYLGALTFAPTIASASLVGFASVNTAPGVMLVGFDFIRFHEGSAWLP